MERTVDKLKADLEADPNLKKQFAADLQNVFVKYGVTQKQKEAANVLGASLCLKTPFGSLEVS